ncbi:hypothetical protein FPRO03_11036 [Fusarium proliferatum]|nr:hypothetical protein FPRO03_11036 [Fusarium proliferatum]
MVADTVLLGWAILSVVIAVVYWICYWIAYGCKSKKQFQDEEQGEVVVNREENYESIFVNPPEQPIPSYTSTSLRGSRRSRGSHDTELPPYKPIGTPPPSYIPAYKALQPDST